MGSSINTTYITINGGASNDVLRTSNLLTDGTFPGYNFTINGLEGDDTLFASDGPFNWPTYGLAHPTEKSCKSTPAWWAARAMTACIPLLVLPILIQASRQTIVIQPI
jgi:hypothetical protein